MQVVAVSAVFGCLCLITTVHGHFGGSLTSSPTDTPCTVRFPRTCGEHVLLGQESTALEEADGYGPNVCRVTKTYEVMTLSYVETEICFRGRCRTYCSATRNCTGSVRNFTTIETGCCDGFAINPEDEAAASSSRKHFSKRRILRDSGCTLMLMESVTECLLELNLDAFTLQLLAQDADAADELGNGDSTDSFTVFGLRDEDIDESASTLGHIVNRTVQGKQLRHGTVLKTLAANVSLHFGRSEENVFANGVEVTQLNACQARNGIVHIVKSPLPQPTMTIADVLMQDLRFSTFLRLLDAADITPFLDVTKGKSRTVLAPTNDAFSQLAEGAVECLLLEENSELLSQLVLIHIGAPAEYTATLSQRTRFFTFNTRYYLIVAVDDDGNVLVTRDQIPLEESDIPASNGVIHALPEVIVLEEVFDNLDCGAAAATTEPSGPQVVGA